LFKIINDVLNRSLKETNNKRVGAGHVENLETLVNQVSSLVFSFGETVS
jgi:hypothetical protein